MSNRMKWFLMTCLAAMLLLGQATAVSAADVGTPEGSGEKLTAVVTMPGSKTVVYNGKVVTVQEAKVTGTTGKVTYRYYVDSECKQVTTYANSGTSRGGGAPVKPGIYYVTATVGEDATYKESTSNVCKLTIKPRQVSSVKVSNLSNGIKVTWKKCTEADGYVVYKKAENRNYIEAAVISGNGRLYYKDLSASGGVKYTYKVAAYKNAGTTKVMGQAGVADNKIAYVKLTVVNTISSAKLKWSEVSSAKGYYIYRKTKGDSQYKKVATIKSGKTITWKDKSQKVIVNGRRATYCVKAYFSKSAKMVAQSGKVKNYFLSCPKGHLKDSVIRWNKNKNADGYIVETYDFFSGYSYDLTTKPKISVLADEMRTKVRVCAYKEVDGMIYVSAWSDNMNVIIFPWMKE